MKFLRAGFPKLLYYIHTYIQTDRQTDRQTDCVLFSNETLLFDRFLIMYNLCVSLVLSSF